MQIQEEWISDQEQALQDVSRNLVPFSGFAVPLIERMKQSKVVFLGDASHGTHEFYRWRAHVSEQLIREHGFNFVAVEGEWPSCQFLTHYLRTGEGGSAKEVLKKYFTYWPGWMWANEEIAEYIETIRNYNATSKRNVGLHGLDVYAHNEARQEVIKHLELIDPELARWAQKSSPKDVHRRLEKLTVEPKNQEVLFEAMQNSRVVLGSQRYYSSHEHGDSWAIRDRHMLSMLTSLFDHYGPDSKGIVWAHVNHVGNYVRAGMGEDGYVNLAGLAYEKYNNVFSIGSGTYEGTVTAAKEWGAETEAMSIPGAPARSFERICHLAAKHRGVDRFLLNFQELRTSSLGHHRSHRFFAVVNDPNSTPEGHFVRAPLSLWYDAYVFFDKTKATNLL